MIFLFKESDMTKNIHIGHNNVCTFVSLKKTPELVLIRYHYYREAVCLGR